MCCSHKVFYATNHRHKIVIEKGNFIVKVPLNIRWSRLTSYPVFMPQFFHLNQSERDHLSNTVIKAAWNSGWTYLWLKHAHITYSVQVLTGVMKLSAHLFCIPAININYKSNWHKDKHTFSSSTSWTTWLYDKAESTTFVDLKSTTNHSKTSCWLQWIQICT